MWPWMASQSSSASIMLESVVRGHHIYKRIWTPVLGEKLQIKIEEDNHHDARPVAVTKDGIAKDGNNCVIYSLQSFDCEF